MNKDLMAEILSLPIADRVRLVEVIWASISASPEAIAVTDWQKEELDRRVDEYDTDPDSGSSIEEVFSRLSRES